MERRLSLLERWPTGVILLLLLTAALLPLGLVLIWELLFPIAVFWRRARWWFLGLGLVFHISTLFVMNIFFPHHLVLYLLFVNWDAESAKTRVKRWFKFR